MCNIVSGGIPCSYLNRPPYEYVLQEASYSAPCNKVTRHFTLYKGFGVCSWANKQAHTGCLWPSPNSCMPWPRPWRQRRKKKTATASSAGVTPSVCTLFVWALRHQTISTWPKECGRLPPVKKCGDHLDSVCLIPPQNVSHTAPSLIRINCAGNVGLIMISTVDGRCSENDWTTTAPWTIWPEVNSPVCCHPAVTNGQIYTHLLFSHTKPRQHKGMAQRAGASHEPWLKAFS